MDEYINTIIKEAKKAQKKGEVPVGAAIVFHNKIIASAHNTKQKKHNVISHAEILCILKASHKLKDWRLNECTLYVTLKPCKMCQEVIKQSRIKHVKYLIESKFNNEDNKNISYELIETKETTEYLKLFKEFFTNKR